MLTAGGQLGGRAGPEHELARGLYEESLPLARLTEQPAGRLAILLYNVGWLRRDPGGGGGRHPHWRRAWP